MQALPDLRPTLWRTCRALANRRRLKILQFLLREPNQSVSAVAQHCRLPLSLASEYLRLLESRGLLKVRRTGKWVKYRPTGVDRASASFGLLRELRSALARDSNAIKTTFRLVTAFTHPKRIDIFRALRTKDRTLDQLHAATQISHLGLYRHLAKLQTRGFVSCRDGVYTIASRSGSLRGELARLALTS